MDRRKFTWKENKQGGKHCEYMRKSKRNGVYYINGATGVNFYTIGQKYTGAHTFASFF